MASSSRDRDDLLSSFTAANHSQSSSPVTVSDPLDIFHEPSGSAPGSFQGEGLLGSGDGGGCSSDADFGFSRPEFRQAQLAGTVQFYERHVFLCYKNPRVWPPRIEAAEFDRLPRLLSAAVSAHKADMKRETRLTICEGHDGTETSNGDVLIFPDMIRYRRLTHFDVDTFVEEVLVKDSEWLPGNPEMLSGSYVFVCSHGSRDRRCGLCGPSLVNRFREEIEIYGLQGKVSVSPCSHVGGHKYAGNVIIFGVDASGSVSGHWYGYVAPEDVPVLLEQHTGRGEIVDRLWRGQMGLSEEEQKKSQEQRFQLQSRSTVGNPANEFIDLKRERKNLSDLSPPEESLGCCPENGSSSCCQSSLFSDKSENSGSREKSTKGKNESKSGKNLLSRLNSGKGNRTRKVCSMPTWYESWEREDTYAALAVLCAAVSVAVAYSCYKQLG
ncbi:hypothetical protein CDL15_Pgr007414 [Punica granatum]|uniref:Altered inheritance of mitochondria protein 32 n=1 Tax=Punica granatum TaxID=22663 RepID=A0A218X9L0_PUNGR|nr:hypothetical protein CDL15_Pgr007414 [Punica granatum]